MYPLEDINTITPKGKSLKQIITDYVREKNLNFIIARGKSANLGQQDLSSEELAQYMAEFSDCSFSKVACPGLKPAPPFLAAQIDPRTHEARVIFLIDLTREAQTGKAGKFYSKMLGALASRFFASEPLVTRLFFPFELADTAGGKGLDIAPAPGGTWVIQT